MDSKSQKKIIDILKEQVYHQTIQKKQLYYSFAQKQNNIGLMFNDRYILLFDCQYFGYVNKIQSQLPFKQAKNIPGCKYKIQINEQLNMKVQEKILEITSKALQSKKNEQIKWKLRFNSTKMSLQWLSLLKKAKQAKLNKVNSSKMVQKNLFGSKIVKNTSKNENQYLQEGKQQKNNTLSNKPSNKSSQPLRQNNKYENNNQINRQNSYNNEQLIKQPSFKQPQKQIVSNSNQNTYIMNKSKIQQNNRNITQQNQLSFSQQAFLQQNKISNQKVGNSPGTQSPKRLFINQQQVQKNQKQLSLKNSLIKQWNKDWNYEILKNHEIIGVISEFRIYVQNIVTQIIDEKCLSIENRGHQAIKIANDYQYYQINGLSIKLCFSQLLQQKLYVQTTIKIANNQFKNLSYIFQCTKHNQNSSIKVPLAVVIEYKGISAFVKSIIYQPNKTLPNVEQQIIQQFSNLTQIQKSIFQDKQNIKITQLQYAINQDNQFQKTKVYFIAEIPNYLPHDIITNTSTSKLRSQFIRNFSNSFTGKTKKQIDKNKIDPEVSKLAQNSKKLYEIINELIKDWQNLEYIIVNSQQLVQLFHSKGINLRYLGLVYENTNIPLIKKICMSEICSRVIKVLLRNHLTEQIKKYNRKLNNALINDKILLINKFDDYLLSKTIQILNSILKNTPQRQLIWQILNKQARQSFNIQINQKQIFQPYFLQAIIYNSNLKIDWDKYDFKYQIFQARDYFKKQMFIKFKPKSKTYDCLQLQPIKTIAELIKQQKQQNYQQLVKILHLQTNKIPSYLQSTKIYQRLLLFLSYFISPPQDQQDSQKLNVYHKKSKEPPSVVCLRINISQIKWAMKQNNKKKITILLDQLTIKIKKWCGDYHPLLGQVFDLFANYHVSRNQFDDAITFAKGSLINCIKTIGNSSIKTAQSYYQLANIFYKSGKKDQALNNYKKSRNIFQAYKLTQSIAMAFLNLKIGSIYLNFGKLNQATECLIKSLKVFEMSDKYQQQIAECYQLLGRLYEVNNKMDFHKQLSFRCSQKLLNIKDPINLERFVKISIYPSLYFISKKNSRRLVQFMNRIPLKYNSQSYQLGYKYLSQTLKKLNLVEYLDKQLQQINERIQKIQSERTLERYKGIQYLNPQKLSDNQHFIAFLEVLLYFIGETFIIGSLKK